MKNFFKRPPSVSQTDDDPATTTPFGSLEQQGATITKADANLTDESPFAHQQQPSGCSGEDSQGKYSSPYTNSSEIVMDVIRNSSLFYSPEHSAPSSEPSKEVPKGIAIPPPLPLQPQPQPQKGGVVGPCVVDAMMTRPQQPVELTQHHIHQLVSQLQQQQAAACAQQRPQRTASGSLPPLPPSARRPSLEHRPSFDAQLGNALQAAAMAALSPASTTNTSSPFTSPRQSKEPPLSHMQLASDLLSSPAGQAFVPACRASIDSGSDRWSLEQPVTPVYPSARYSTSNIGSNRSSEEGSLSLMGQGSLPHSASLNGEILAQLLLYGPKIKTLVSTGGKFASHRNSAGKPATVCYEGGEVRLVSIPQNCTLPQLIAVLSKTERNLSLPRSSSGSTLSKNPAGTGGSVRPGILRYRLPSDPNVYVDLVDDEDVRMMFEEESESRAKLGPTSPKLHIFVQWTHGVNSKVWVSADADIKANFVSMVGDSEDSSDDGSGTITSATHAAHASASDLNLLNIRSPKLEIIPPEDITLVELLGCGSYGDMFRGRWRQSDVGVKVLNPVMAGVQYSSRASWEAFLADANARGALRHPNLVEVYGIVLPTNDQSNRDGVVQRLPGPVAHPPALVSEYVKGQSLRGALKRRCDAVAGRLTRVIYALDTASAMAYLHSKGISHHDLKSSNVLLGYRNRRPIAKVCGYGLSPQKTARYTPGVTASSNMLPWIAPEIFRGPELVSAKSDQYAFGIIMWELWTFCIPYEGRDMKEMLKALTETNQTVRPWIPGEEGQPRAEEPAEGWKDLMEACWAENPNDRPEFEVIVGILKGFAKSLKVAQRTGSTPSGTLNNEQQEIPQHA